MIDGYNFSSVRHGIAAGDQWGRVLETEQTASRIVVLVVSQKVLESQWVFSEITLARREGIPVVPVLAEVVKLPLWLLDLQALDFSARVDWVVLLAAVRKKIPPVPPFAKGGTRPVWTCAGGNPSNPLLLVDGSGLYSSTCRQYVLYQLLLKHIDPKRKVYLAITHIAYDEIFSEPIGELVVNELPMDLVVIDTEVVEVKKWIRKTTGRR